MATAFERLRAVPLFDGLSDDDLTRICTDVRDVVLGPGALLFREGEHGDRAYVIAEGQVEVVKTTDRREVLLAVRGPGDVIGEMAMLLEEPRIATVRARGPATLLAIPKAALDQLLEASPHATRALFQTFLTRMRATTDQVRQSERMAQLGTLTAGVAHELNNPAAAVARAADGLEDQLVTLIDVGATTDATRARDAALALARRDGAGPTDALARSDAEDRVAAWLETADVARPWELAGPLVDGGITATDLDAVRVGDPDPVELDRLVRLVVAVVAVRALARDIGEGAGRISTIVRALKSYAYLDQSPVQDVDVHRGLDDTLALLAHRTRAVTVVRDYAPDLPRITALGTELNQVWTNLVDNACDALADGADGLPTLTLRTRAADGDVVVEVEDNGPGIPDEVRDRIFDAFFTTKPPGQGTGLGLQISYRIVVLEHGGDLTVASRPGSTVFRVTLPVDPPGREPAMDVEPCDHLRALVDPPRPEGGCPACLATGSTWVHLRYCDQCGQVGCCDDSPNRHARAHAADSGHPVIRSLEPGEAWAWCMQHEVGIVPS